MRAVSCVAAAVMLNCVLIYTPVGLLGYFSFGSTTSSDILDDFGKKPTVRPPTHVLHSGLSRSDSDGHEVLGASKVLSAIQCLESEDVSSVNFPISACRDGLTTP